MSKGNDSRSIVIPIKEANQLRKIADKSDRKGFDYPSRTAAARAAIYLALHHEWTKEEVVNAFAQVGEDDESQPSFPERPTAVVVTGSEAA